MCIYKPEASVYAVATMMDSYGHAICTTITALPSAPNAVYQMQLIQRPEGVVHVEYFTQYKDVLRHLKGAEAKPHRLARALVSFIEAVTGIA